MRAYRAAVQAYHEAGSSFDLTAFHDALQRMELARNQAETARTALLRHEHLHMASDRPKVRESGTDQITIIGSTVALFNVGTEHWDLFEIGVCGPPPTGALAYMPSRGNETGQWIVDPQELSDREKQNAKLFFTEAGLAILREAGLEM
ncbi:MAG: hypothetical protein WDO18_19905 [Acidobacteriota bacterium]